MYHFTADHPPESVRLSFRALIPGHIRQYLKNFQLDAIRFMHNFLAKGEFCVYNDESGLGKQAAAAVLLDAVRSSRKCLIVVQNDDRYVNGWEFHLNVLTNTSVTVINDEKDSTDSSHNIYIAKWSTLRTIDDLSKFKFDFIILDNRGQMLSNTFCTSMLLKHYERKINILISSVDITSDLKLLHNVLRLGDRLEPQYSSFKTFEEKFKLPDAKELAYKRVDLEEYFCKRERLADYCKAFRLRRYCHQFENQLPLVKEDRYKINLNLWREKQNATNSESSSIDYVNNQNREDEHVKDTQELFEEYCRQRRKEHLQFQQEEEKRLQQREQERTRSLQAENEVIYNVDDEVALINETRPTAVDKPTPVRDNSDEPVLMSPLMVESDDDDDFPEICNDPNNDIEIVDLSNEEREEEQQQHKQNKQTEKSETRENNKQSSTVKANEETANKKATRKKWKRRSELANLEENIVDSLKLTETARRITRHAKEDDVGKTSNKRLKDRLELKKIIESKSKKTNANERTPKTKSVIKIEKNIESLNEKSYSTQKTLKDNQKATRQLGTKENCSTPTSPKDNNKKISSSSSKYKCNSNKITKETTETSNSATSLTSRRSRSMQNVVEKPCNETPTKTNDLQVKIKQENLEEIPQTRKSNLRDSQAKVLSEKLRLKRELEMTPVGVHHKQTRSMQRLTRSAGSSNKYLTKNLSLHIDKVTKTKKKAADKEISAETLTNKTKKAAKENKPKEADNNTQISVISHRSSQDYESLQCAQRLSGAVIYEYGTEKSAEFLVPPAPTRNSLLPSSLNSSAGFFTESDVIFVPPSNPSATTTNKKREQVILLSSSDNENSTSQSSQSNTSRRTRALKPKRSQQNNTGNESSRVASFSELLAQQNTRASAKSPDLFSNCSDLAQLPCTQPQQETEEPNTPFEGFKIFGSEVKQLQQHYATTKLFPCGRKSYRDQRSCLDILEKMFEPSNKKLKQTTNGKSANVGDNNTNPTTHSKKSTRGSGGLNKQKTRAPILPSHPIEAIAEARQQLELQKRKRSTQSTSVVHEDEIFEITNNGTFGSVMRLHSNGDISPVQHTQKTNNKQHNKITNYLIGNTTQNGSSGSQDEITANSGQSSGNNLEAGTPSKRHQQLAAVQNSGVKKSPKGKCNSTQVTKLTKWFTKPSDPQSSSGGKTKSSNSKKTPTKQVQPIEEVDLTSSQTSTTITGKRILKRRRLDLSFNK